MKRVPARSRPEPRRSRWWLALVVNLLLGAFVALAACSNQAEGERCDVLNGNEDCQDGLFCKRKEDVNAPFKNADRCCPSDVSRASHPACTAAQSAVDSGTPPPNTGPDAGDAEAVDTGVDAGSDAGGDATSDAADAADAADG